ncbi:hypothetical protein P171DRAFT_450732 [Karstenula rhodostoma CBS 690.94]|uniref:Uncharacterized protein n=1 Tax=Karstenula rhodostoma CBS 690.94 TaxID=1392251 RepID=A0A9P4PXJ7_9PLEO|nr:hypothetical protein P171DRAFT_450732 [Karstenula rhodostoma CBS 690.94]
MSFYRRLPGRTAALALLTWLVVALVLHLRAERQLSTHHRASIDPKTSNAENAYREDAGNSSRRTAVVVAKTASENATWLDDYFPQWEKNIYSVGDRKAKLKKIPKNKGRESMVYLSYIIDNYDRLPDNVLFLHPNRYQWHNDDPDYDGVPMLRHFQMPYLEQEGYVNIRCAWSLGCPDEIKPLVEEGEHRDQVHAGGDYKKAFQVLFPGVDVPTYVGVSCCAQFAATKEKIREREKSDYQRYRRWLLETDLEDSISGRIMEYSWHMIFGKDPVHCPLVQVCYCKVFGLCNLQCEDQGSCRDRYTLPLFATLPEGWPYIDWDQEDRERAGPED